MKILLTLTAVLTLSACGSTDQPVAIATLTPTTTPMDTFVHEQEVIFGKPVKDRDGLVNSAFQVCGVMPQVDSPYWYDEAIKAFAEGAGLDYTKAKASMESSMRFACPEEFTRVRALR